MLKSINCMYCAAFLPYDGALDLSPHGLFCPNGGREVIPDENGFAGEDADAAEYIFAINNREPVELVFESGFYFWRVLDFECETEIARSPDGFRRRVIALRSFLETAPQLEFLQ